MDFDRRIKLEFHGARITSDGGRLAYRELDGALGLTDVAITQLLDGRRGKKGCHTLVGRFRQSVFGRLAGYEHANDAERLAHDPAMRAIVGREGLERFAASSSQMGRFETEWLASDANLSGTWINWVHARKAPEGIILDMDSSESPTCHAFPHNAVRLQLHALADNLANFMRTLALPKEVEHWSLTTLREKLVKIGARIVRHGRYVAFQLAEVAVPRSRFASILRRIDDLRPRPPPLPA